MTRRQARHNTVGTLCLVLTLVVVNLPAGPAHASRPVDQSSQLFVLPESHISPILHLLRMAHQSIRLEVYLLTNRTIIAELQRARQRGINVRVLLEQHPFGGIRYAQLGYRLLGEARVPVRWANEGAFTYTHEKAVSIDDRIAGVFTFNLTSSGLYRNREFGVIDTDTSDVQSLTSVFDADWTRRPALYKPRSHLVISPYNARQQFNSLIDGARRSLEIYAEEVNDGSVESHLESARRRGVRVRLLTSRNSTGVDALRNTGIEVRIVAHPYIHAKAILVDGTSLFLGSENISATSLDRNREMGLLVRQRASVLLISQTFERDWQNVAGSSEPPTIQPSSNPAATSLQISVSPPHVRRGNLITVAVTTSAGAQCTIRVTYPDGYVSRAHALTGSRVVSSDAVLRWSWRVGSRVKGRAEIRIGCALAQARPSGTASFIIE